MGHRGLTRRSLLGAAGGSLAALGRAPRVLAARAAHGGPRRNRGLERPATAAPSLAEQSLGRLGPGLATVALEHSADLLALAWREPPGARPQLRFQTPEGGWSPWVPAAHGAHEESPAGASPRRPR